MSIQDNNALALDTLSIIQDSPPNPVQPHLIDGIQLRWVPGAERGFPLKGGYYLFRRRVAGGDTTPVCVMPRLKDRDSVIVASQGAIDTGIGTLAAGSGLLLKPRSLYPPGTIGIGGFAIDQTGLRFSLPANTTTNQFTVQLQFATPVTPSVSPASKALTSQIVIVVYKGATVLTRQIVASPPYQPTITITANPPGADAIQISGVGADLVELCYERKPSGSGPPISTPPAKNAAAQSTAAIVPGQGWEMIPSLTSAIKLPLIHPQYPASPGPESINASKAIANSRVRYGVWQDSFPAGTSTPGAGTISLTNGSPLVTGSGTNWTTSLVGSLIRLPRAGSDYTAYAVMAVLASNCIVLSRSYSGTNRSNAPYQLLKGDSFAELHDQIASLLQSPNDMRVAIVPPPLDQGTVAAGKFAMVFAQSDEQSAQVNGIGTQWTTSLAGCYIEIGPGWSQTTYLAGSNIYRIQSVNAASSQLTLDRPFSGLPHLAPYVKCDYRIFARATGDDPGANTPSFDFKPMDLLELASLMPSYAQALGLYWIDARVTRGDVFDYIVIADYENRFSQQVSNALSWLNGTPDFTGDSVDGFIKFGVKHLGSPPLPPPTQLELFRLSTGGARVSIAHPDRADCDVGISVKDAASWADPNAPQPTPVMLNLSRLSRGTDATNLAPVGNDATGYYDRGRLLLSRRNPVKVPNPPAGWPTEDPIHFVDSGLDVGWYSFRAFAIDLYGRFSLDSAPIPWKNIDNLPERIADAIHLRDTTPPPPPAGVRAWMLDDRDPYMVRDEAFTSWRSQFAGAMEWANWQPGTPFPAATAVLGLRLNFRWPWSHQNQGPDVREFRVYALENPINARTGRVTSVSPVSGHPKQSLVTLDLDVPVSTSVDAYNDSYKNASLQAGNRAFPILGSQGITANPTTSVQLTVKNGGPLNTVPPDSNVDGAIVIPAMVGPSPGTPHPLHKELLNPGNWEKWLAAIPQNLAGTRYDVEMVEDPNPVIVPFDGQANTFVGTQATWNGSAFVLGAIPTSHDLAAVRPGIDVLSLSSEIPPGYFVTGIQSVDIANLRITPVQAPDSTLANSTIQWRIGPANAGLQGLAGSWNATTGRFSLDGSPNLSNVTVGADLVYIAAPGATPANLNFFFAIEALDTVNHTVTLTGNVSVLPDGASLAWKIGWPVRHYEVFLPHPAAQVVVATDSVTTLLSPTLAQPVQHGTIGVSSVDYRDEVADQYRPTRNRKGNESWLSGPAPVYRVMRDPVPAPTFTWNVTRLYATRANYHDDSYFTMRWDKPAAGYHAHVFRAMDSSIFLAHLKLSSPLSISGAPLGISVLLNFDAHRASFHSHATAAAAAELNHDDATFKTESALAQIEYSEAAKLYDLLNDETLRWLAGRPELADAYMQVTIKPLDLSDQANWDRLGPDDNPNTFIAKSTVCAYIDKLPGKSTNRYFYAVMLLDGAQNRSALGSPTPPVYMPKVVPPRKPSITKVLGGDRQITIRWAANREPDLAGYCIYRTDDERKAEDVRLMDLVHTEVMAAGPPSGPSAEMTWTDMPVQALITYRYRLTSVDVAGNASPPSPSAVARAFDDSRPIPPAWNPPVVGAKPDQIDLSWISSDPNLICMVERSDIGLGQWHNVSGWLARGTYAFTDTSRTTGSTYDYRLRVLDSRSRQNNTFTTLTI